MKEHYGVMNRLVPSGFLASDRMMVWRLRLSALFDFLQLFIKDETTFMWSVPIRENGTHENTMTANTHTAI